MSECCICMLSVFCGGTVMVVTTATGNKHVGGKQYKISIFYCCGFVGLVLNLRIPLTYEYGRY